MRRLFIAFLLLAVAMADAAAADRQFTTGKFLVAGPDMRDSRFAESVVLMFDHDAGGAFGLIINKALGDGPLLPLLKGFEIEPLAESPEPETGGSSAEKLDGTATQAPTVRLYYGGPVDQGAIFIVHSPDYLGPATKVIVDVAVMTRDLAVLKDLARGKGPQHLLLVLGYAGWAAGQLDAELARGDWLVVPVDPAVLFGDDAKTMWRRLSDGVGVPL